MIVLAPLWKWVVAPVLVKLPDNINETSYYEGVLTLNVDPNSMQVLPPDMPVKIPLTITRKDVSAPEKSDGSVAVIKETAVAKGPGGKDFLAYTKYYALDRKTAKNVTSDQADVKNRTGYSITLGFFVNKDGTYPFWDDDTRTATNLEFVKTDTMDGFQYKGIPVIVWKGGGEAKTVTPPLGLPSKISGAQVKAIIPSLTTLNDTEMYPIDYIKRTTATVVVDQKAGTVVSLPAYQEEYFVDASALGQGKIKLATLNYHQTPASVKTQLDHAAKTYKLLDSVETYIPIGLLVIGLIELIIGLILYLRKKPA